jgi:peroxiredoxin
MNKPVFQSLLACLLVSLVVMSGCGRREREAVSFGPETPRPGRSVEVIYRPAGTPLEKAREVSLTAYLYVKGMPEVRVLPMARNGSSWRAALKTEPESRGAVLKFTSGQALDSNDHRGYVLILHDEQGSPVAGHRAGLAEALASWGYQLAGMDIDKGRALALLEEDFAAHPDIKQDHLPLYFTLLLQKRSQEESSKIILRELSELQARPDLSAEGMMILINWYTRLGLPSLAGRFISSLKEKEPRGELVQAERFQRFFRETDLGNKAALVRDFRRDFPEADKMQAQFHFFMAGAYREAGLYAEAARYLEANPFTGSRQLFINLVWSMLRDGADLGLAERLAVRAVEIARAEIADPKRAKPFHLTDGEWARQGNASLAEALDALGFLRLRLLKSREALGALEEAAGLLEGKDIRVNEHFAAALVQAADPAAALAGIEAMVKTGRATRRTKELLREAFVAARGTEEGGDLHLARVEDAGREALKADLRLKIRRDPAPDFSLTDLAGETVTLAGLRGRVVVLEFWASWCQPCLDSFPGWRLAAEKFKEDPDVRFLFINSWERTDDRRKNAADFLSANGYSFRILLDLRDETIDAFGVNGIPTSFVIDGRGRVRFRNEGFTGDADGLVEELSQMIDLAR